MKLKSKLAAAIITFIWLCFSASLAQSQTLEEPAYLASRITSGELPPMAERLPKTPKVVDIPALGKEYGNYGGSIEPDPCDSTKCVPAKARNGDVADRAT